MPEIEHNPIERLLKETMIDLVRQSIEEAHRQNPNALGFVVHGSRASEGNEGAKQPRIDSDLDIIPIRSNGDDKAPEELAGILWRQVGPQYNILVDTGPWGSLEWEEVLAAVDSQGNRERFRQEWGHLGDTPIIIGANPEVEAAVKKAFLE